MDSFIRQGLKNWAATQQPPKNGKARLLLVASHLGSAQDLSSKYSDHQGYVTVGGISDQLPHLQTNGSFYQPFLWVLQLNLTPIKNVT